MKTVTQDPDDTLDYQMGLSDLFEEFDDEDSIQTVNVLPEGLENELSVIPSPKGKDAVVAWVSGGVAGKTYKVTLRVFTASSRVKDISFKVKIKEV